MNPNDPKPLSHYFQEGVEARRNGLSLRENPYAAGSQQRREWTAGFCATVECEDDDSLELDPNEGAKRPSPGSGL